MQNINFRYARWLNQQMNRIGHLFQARYVPIEVCDEEYLINLCRYIHLNPVSARMVQSPANYAWSSHCFYEIGKGPDWMDLSKISSAIQHKTGLTYPDFIKEKPDRESWKPMLFLSKSGKLVIDDTVVNAINEKQKSSDKKNVFLSVNDVTEILSKYLKTNPKSLLGPNRNRSIARKRALVAHYMSKYCELDMSQIAKHFNRSQSALGRQVENIIISKERYFSPISLEIIDNALDKKRQELALLEKDEFLLS